MDRFITEPVFPTQRVGSCALCSFFHHFHTIYLPFCVCEIMGTKKKKAKDSGVEKKRMILIELKPETTEKHKHGVQVLELARQYDRNTSTICTILKQRDAIKSVTPA